MKAVKFGEDYREKTVLRDGTRVILRRLNPADRAEILRGFERLSEHSRYLRFLSSKHELTDEDLEFLTHMEGLNQFGIVALLEDPGGATERGVGVARFVRSEEDDTVAEPAVTVSDEIQGRGLGGILSRRLAEAASERGIATFRCYLLAENRRVLGMLHSVFPEVRLERAGELLIAHLNLAGATGRDGRHPRPA